MIQTKTPPWERHRHHRTPSEEAIALAWAELYRTPAEAAWSELCALQAVAEAVQEYVVATNGYTPLSRVAEAWDRVKSALAALEAICPR